MATTALRSREHDALFQSLRSGVTPRSGFRRVMRKPALWIGDLARIAQGGASFRLIIGGYASSKTFFLNLVPGAAMEHQLIVTHADLTPRRRLHEIPANSTKIKPPHIPEITPEYE